MTIAEVSIKYGQIVTVEQIEQLNKALIYGPLFERDEAGAVCYWTKHVVSIESMPTDVAFDVSRVLLHPSLTELDRQRNPMFNQKVKVSVPGNGLLSINKVWVVNDCCTEELQRHLNDGWCILAVCPQPDQRRPDYVLGKRLDLL